MEWARPYFREKGGAKREFHDGWGWLDKYKNKLSKNGKKINKIKRITVHYYETSKESTFPSSNSVGEDSD